jgi:PAS domain S-box-containing protein
MESELKKEQEKFQALFEHASMGIVVTNSTGEMVIVNKYLLGQFGYTEPGELIGKAIEVLIPRRYDHVHHKHRENYGKHPGPRSMGVGRDLFGLKKDGSEFPVEVSLSNYNTAEGMFVIAFVIDITLRKEIETAVLVQKAQLEASHRQIEELNNELEGKVQLRTSQLQEAMELIEGSRDELTKALDKEKELGDLKSRFVSMASHEFRTPLSTILSSASLLAKYTESGEQDKRDKHINRIKASVINLTGILNEFLSIGKIEDGKIEVRYVHFNVKEFVTQLCLEMQVQVKQDQKIAYTHSGGEDLVLDESLLRNILFNLLSNAIKFSHPGGLINVETRNDGMQFTISITDNGIGIAEEDQAHLFERFFRASNVTNIQGTGLGLHIVAKYVELMNGEITWKSELEKGTNFTIIFTLLKH